MGRDIAQPNHFIYRRHEGMALANEWQEVSFNDLYSLALELGTEQVEKLSHEHDVMIGTVRDKQFQEVGHMRQGLISKANNHALEENYALASDLLALWKRLEDAERYVKCLEKDDLNLAAGFGEALAEKGNGRYR